MIWGKHKRHTQLQTLRINLGSKVDPVTVTYLIFVFIALLLASTGLGENGIRTVATSYIWPSPDRPGDASRACSTPLIENHYFGDFQSDFCRMKSGSIYSDKVVMEPVIYVLKSRAIPIGDHKPLQKDELERLHVAYYDLGQYITGQDQSSLDQLFTAITSGRVSYQEGLQAINKVRRVASWYPPSFYVVAGPFFLTENIRISFLSFVVLSLCLWLSAVILLRASNRQILEILFIAYPIFFSFVRGNVGWMLAGPLFCLWALTTKNEKRWGWLFLVVATSLKPQLAIFMSVYLVRRELKLFFTSLLGLFGLNVIGSVLFFEDIGQLRDLIFRMSASGGFGLSGLRYDISALTYKFWGSVEVVGGVSNFLATLSGPVGLVILMIWSIASHVNSYRIDQTRGNKTLDEGLVMDLCSLSILFMAPSYIYTLIPLSVMSVALFGSSWRKRITLIVSLPVLIPVELLRHPNEILENPSKYIDSTLSNTLGTTTGSILLLGSFVLRHAKLLRRHSANKRLAKLESSISAT